MGVSWLLSVLVVGTLKTEYTLAQRQTQDTGVATLEQRPD